MVEVLRAGVVGAGVFGGHHARKYAGLPGVALTAVMDPHLDRAEALAGPLGARGHDGLDAFLEAVDIVTVASPANAHADAAAAALAAGKHVYVEKPLATRLRDGRALVAAADAANVVLACGHQERAVFQSMGLIGLPERPVLLEAVRRGPPTGRNLDVSCVLDLMIHDIDLALALNPGAVSRVAASGRAGEGAWADEVRAELVFADGAAALLQASRVAEARERTMRIVFPSGEVNIDFLARTFTDTTPFGLDAGFAETSRGSDPLGASVSDFVAAVRGEAYRPLVTGGEAVRALKAALDVERAAQSCLS